MKRNGTRATVIGSILDAFLEDARKREERAQDRHDHLMAELRTLRQLMGGFGKATEDHEKRIKKLEGPRA